MSFVSSNKTKIYFLKKFLCVRVKLDKATMMNGHESGSDYVRIDTSNRFQCSKS